MRAVHERVLLLTIITEKVARVPRPSACGSKSYRTASGARVARYGFMETPNVPELLRRAEFNSYSLEFVTFFLGRETVLATKHSGDDALA